MEQIACHETPENGKQLRMAPALRGLHAPRYSSTMTEELKIDARLDRRALLRDEAARIFAEHGYHGASMQEIADAIGFTKASIYYYYKGKEDLLFDMLSFADEQISALFAAEALKGHDPLTHVHQLVSIHVTWYLQHPDIAKVAFRDWTALTGAMLEIQIDRRRRHSRILRDGIERCRTEGLIPADAKVGLMTNFINGAVAASNVWFKPYGPETPETVGAAFGEMALAVLKGGAGSLGQV